VSTTYEDLLARVIDDGIVAASRDYARSPSKRRGAVAGFEACRGKSPDQLRQLLHDARLATRNATERHHPLYRKRLDAYWETRCYEAEIDAYWETRCYEAEIEWVCNVVSAALANQGLPTIVPPTARGVMAAAVVLGVGETKDGEP